MTPCIHTRYALDRYGYGKRKWNGRHIPAHRVAYCQAKGLSLDEIAGKVVMHTCDNRACVNPEHLVLGTQAENMADMIRKGRSTNPGNRKLTQEDAEEIRRSFVPRSRDTGAAALARRFGVGESTIWKILNHDRYRETP